MIATDYAVQMVPIGSISPSPENDEIYGEIEFDEQMKLLVDSIMCRDLEEPIIATADGYIISGHRRYFACEHLGYDEIPVRFKNWNRSEVDDYHQMLVEYNPQRIKTAGVLLREALTRLEDEDSSVFLQQKAVDQVTTEVEYLQVGGSKIVRDVSEKKREFLDAATAVIAELKPFWPLSIRQVHYNLLNDPPRITVPKNSKFIDEHYRYKNDKTSYDALVELLRAARYHGYVAMHVIDDVTRPRVVRIGYDNLSHFVTFQLDNFLKGYHRSPQLDQPRHIELLGEKNTLMQIVSPVCNEYYIPLTLGRGYASIPVFRDMAKRFHASGKKYMTLIVASDYDPEGLDLAEDAVRTLRDCFEVDVDYHRVGITRDQIDELNLAADFNPAKQTSSRLKSFVEKTGSTDTWELEALPPTFLREKVREAILENMDSDLLERSQKQLMGDATEIAKIRIEIAGNLTL